MASLDSFPALADSLYKDSPIGVLVFDGVQIIYMNEKLAEITGYSPDELVHQSFVSKIHPDDLDKVMQGSQEVYPGRKPGITNRFRIFHKSGEIRELESTEAVIDWMGKRFSIVSVVDITDMIRSQDRLNVTEDLYRTVFENTGTAMLISQEDMTISLVNSEFEKLSGYKKEELEGKIKWNSLITSEDREKMMRFHQDRREGGFVPSAYHFSFVDQQGNIRHSFLKVTLIPGTRQTVASIIDLSDLHQAQREAQEAFQIFEDVLENSPFVAIQGYSPEGTIMHWNKASFDVYGFTYEEVIGKSFEVISMFRDIADEFRQELKGIVETGKPIPPREWEVIRADGSTCKVLSSLFPVYWDGKVVEIFCMDVDVTNFHNALEELNVQKAYFQQLFANSPEAIALLDPEDRITDCNTIFEKLFEFDKSQILGKKINALIVPEEKMEEAEDITRKCRDGQRVILETIRKTSSGKHFHVLLADAPIVINDKPIGAYMIYHDISRRKEAEKALEISEAQHRLVTEKASDVIVRYFYDGSISFVSPSATRITGISTDELRKFRIHDFLHPDEAPMMLEYLNMLREGLQPFYIRMRLRSGISDYTWFQCITQLVEDNGDKSEYITFARDITEEIRNEQIIREKEAAELANQAKSMFLANMSHEIRNPMNAITGMISSLAKTDLTKEQKVFVDSLRISSGNLLGIINDILDFSKIEAGKEVLTETEFTQQDIIEDVMTIYAAVAENSNIQFKTECHCQQLYTLQGDFIKIKQMLNNLLSNAFKFTEKGEVLLIVSEKERDEKIITLKFEVRDTGIGIRKEDFDKIYQVFTQVDSSTTKSYSGTGLGLAIVKKYTELLGGNTYFTSTFGKGSQFFLEIPLRYSEMADKPGLVNATLHKASSLPLRVLLAEDDGINQLYLKNLLSEQGYQVDTASNGKKVLELFDKNEYDVILMDGQMPVMDGFEATREIRKKEASGSRRTPIIAITGYAISGDKEKFIEAGMDDYITKPINEQMLIHTIQKVQPKS